MKYIRNELNSNKIIYRKYTKNYQHNRKIKTFLKSNYKYKRRCLRKTNSDQGRLDHKYYSQSLQSKNHRRKQKQKIYLMVKKHIVKRIIIYDNTRLECFLRIVTFIMQQAEQTTTATIKSYMHKNKYLSSNGLAIRFFAKIKTIEISNTLPSLLNVNYDGINKSHHAYKDANTDTDNYIDIKSNIADEIRNQQHNYDKVSTITSTPIKCQRRKHHHIKSTKTSILSLSSSSSLSPIAPSISSTPTKTTWLLSLPSIVIKINYKIYQWPAMLHDYVCESPSIHHHKYKHTQSPHQYHLQHHQQQRQQHALHIKPFTSGKLLSESNKTHSNSSISKNNSISINRNKGSKSNIGTTTDQTTYNGVTVHHQSDAQYVNSTSNRSYTLSCLLLSLFIVFTIGVRSTTAGACWQTVLDNGKCNEIFSLNISKSECCGANQEFAYTEREPTNVEYFFATAIGGGMECSPCLENCKNVKCGPNKKCVKRKGRPKCICAPECGAVRRRRKQQEHLMQQEQQHHQHHTFHLISSIAKEASDRDNVDDNVSTTTKQSAKAFKIKIDKSQQSRDTRSLSSEITNVNLGLESGKDVMMINGGGITSQIARHHINNKEHNENQRKLIQMHMQRNSYPHNTKEPNDFQQYTHQIQQQQQLQHQHQLQIEQQELKHKDQEPKGSRRVLITANVEHTEKPTTIRLQIFSNVGTTHARRHNSKKNNNKSNKNRNRNKHDQEEDTDPSDSYDEEHKEFDYSDAEENGNCDEAKRKYCISDNNNSNNNKNKNNRNDDATRFLNQSTSRHNLKNIIKTRNNNGNNSSSNSNSNSSSNNNKKKNQKIKTKLKTNHDLQQHFSNNNTRIKHSKTNGRQAEDASHRSHHQQNRNHHQHCQQHQEQHKDQHQKRNHHKHHQHRQNHHRHHDRQKKHNRKKQQQQQQQHFTELKKPKNNRDFNANIAVLTSTTSDAKELEPCTTLLQTKTVNISSTIVTITPLPNLSSSSSSLSSLSSSEEVLRATTTTIITTPIQQSPSQLLCSSSTMSSLTTATPVNSTMSTINSTTAVSDTANDHYHSHLPNHGSKIATSSSSSQSPSSTSLSDTQLSASAFASARSSSELPVVPSGEGVLQYDHHHRHIKIPASINNSSNNNNKNADHLVSALNSNLHNNMPQHQQQDQQMQSHQQYFHSSLFDAISDQIDLMGIPNKQQHITNAENIRPLNPVCGTDGRTYNTECQLRKRACRTDNPNLQIAYRGHCKTTCNGVKCLNGLTCVEDQYSLPHCIACKIECLQDDYNNDVADAKKAVCGADGKTYKSVCDINRMICKIGRSIGVAYLGPCREEQITCDDINCGPKQVCLIDLMTHKPRCTSCRYKCSRKRSPLFTHTEESKICGTNNRTYNSWCEMRKDSCSTGFYIDLKYSGNCH